MNHTYRSFLVMIMLTTLAAVFLVACAKTPKLTKGGEQVEYVDNVEFIQDKLDDPAKCKLMASLEVEADVAVGISESTMISEQKRRLVRARNMAAENDGNVLVKDGEVSGKAQKFKTYKCN